MAVTQTPAMLLLLLLRRRPSWPRHYRELPSLPPLSCPLTSAAIRAGFAATRSRLKPISTARISCNAPRQFSNTATFRAPTTTAFEEPRQTVNKDASNPTRRRDWSSTLALVWRRVSLVAFCLIVAEYTIAGRIMAVTGQSMAPTLSPDYTETGRRDYVWASTREVLFHSQQDIPKGSIVAFWSPQDPDKLVIKRIVALPGETVKTRAPYPLPEVLVPPGHIWVEGEDWRMSKDSNEYGPISMNLIVGKTTHIIWPLNRAGRVQ